jgi:hypothetical protein
VWIVNNSIYEQIPNIQLAPMYDEAIKAVDPFEDMKDGIFDYVTF